VRHAEKKFGQAREVLLKRLLVERDSGKTQKVVLEVVQVPRDRLPIETGAGIANFVIQIPTGFNLEARKNGEGLAISIDYGGGDVVAMAVLRQKPKERGVAKVLLEISVVGEIIGVDLGNRKAV